MKITKTQLRQIIKEEVQKELDESFLDGIKDFLTGGGLTANQERAIKNRTQELMASGPLKGKEYAAGEQAKKDFKAGLLDTMGKLKSSGKSSEPEGEPDWRNMDWNEKERAEIAGMKSQQRRAAAAHAASGKHWSGRELTDKEKRIKHHSRADMSSKNYGRKSYNYPGRKV